MSPPTKEQIGMELRQELRSIIRQRDDLSRPLSRFEVVLDRPADSPRFYIMFDMNPRQVVNGLRIGSQSVCLPDERIRDAFFHLAKAIWHLKDRLVLWAWAAGFAHDRQQAKHIVHAIPNGSLELRICTDLANKKKHGENQNRSGLRPNLSQVTFDTRNSGPLELYFDGATKQKELLVSLPAPIAFKVDVLAEPGGTIFGDATDVMNAGFASWLPLIESLDALPAGDAEADSLRRILFPTK